MSIRQDIVRRLADGPVTGPAMAEEFGITRTAVWKHIDALRQAGFEIDSGPHGYRVESVPEYGAEAVAFGLSAPFRIEYHDRIASTNDRARSLARAGKRNVVVLADHQPAGRGRLDRTWVGPAGGIYLSVVLTPSLPPMAAPRLTLTAGVAVARALEAIDVEPAIKWPNDVLHRPTEQKLAGILTEMRGETDRVEWVVIGIGINANVDPADLPASATSIRAIRGDVERRLVVQSVLDAIDALAADPETVLEEWRDRSCTLDRRVRVTIDCERLDCRAVDIDRSGSLLVRLDDGTITQVHAGDCEHLRRID